MREKHSEKLIVYGIEVLVNQEQRWLVLRGSDDQNLVELPQRLVHVELQLLVSLGMPFRILPSFLQSVKRDPCVVTIFFHQQAQAIVIASLFRSAPFRELRIT